MHCLGEGQQNSLDCVRNPRYQNVCKTLTLKSILKLCVFNLQTRFVFMIQCICFLQVSE